MNVHWSLVVAVVVLLAYSWYPRGSKRIDGRIQSGFHHKNATAAQHAHKREWENPETNQVEGHIVMVHEDVYVAVGYGLANSILLLGDDGYIIIDALESPSVAETVQKEFERYIGGRPLVAVIYTHNHQDHCFGTRVFVGDRPLAPPQQFTEEYTASTYEAHPSPGDGDERPVVQVWSHAQTIERLERALSLTSFIEFRRGMRQFGSLLPSTHHVHSGIGVLLDVDTTTIPGMVVPTHTFAGIEHTLKIAGFNLRFIHAPGETDDQIVVWDEERSILYAADNVYKTFPNLYAIRGTPARDANKWAESIWRMRELNANIMVPSHTRPLVGAARISEVLSAYHDGIKFVHDQTVRYLNQGKTTQEIVELVHLPPHLREHPYLQEFYGTVEWSVRGVVQFYLGWFGGHPVDLAPLSQSEHAKRMLELGGGELAVLERSKQACEERDFQWCLELTTEVLRVSPENAAAREYSIRALRGLASKHSSANGRNYYSTFALELEQDLSIAPSRSQIANAVKLLDVDLMFRSMPTTLVAEETLEVDESMLWHFTDIDRCYFLHIYRGVVRSRKSRGTRCVEEYNPTVTAHTTSDVFRSIAARERLAAMAVASGEIEVEGGVLALGRMMGRFKQPADVV